MKRPRHYASEIITTPVGEWRDRLAQVPEWCRDHVRKYLLIENERRKYKNNRK